MSEIKQVPQKTASSNVINTDESNKTREKGCI
mgnify:CR=1 FL=1